MKEVRIGEAFGEAWEGAKNNWLMYLALGGIYLGVQLVTMAIKWATDGATLASVLIDLIGIVVNIGLVLLAIKFNLQIAAKRGAKVELFSEMELSSDELVRYLLTYLLQAALTVAVLFACFLPVGALALITIGLAAFSKASLGQLLVPLLISVVAAVAAVGYLYLMLGQSLFACLHQGLGPWDSLMESKRLTEGAKGGLFALSAAGVGLLFAGLICLLVGAIPAAIVVFLAHAVVYYSLLEQSGPRPTAP